MADTKSTVEKTRRELTKVECALLRLSNSVDEMKFLVEEDFNPEMKRELVSVAISLEILGRALDMNVVEFWDNIQVRIGRIE